MRFVKVDGRAIRAKHLKLHALSDVVMQRRVRVVKLRGSNHKTGFYALLFDAGRFSVTPAMSA